MKKSLLAFLFGTAVVLGACGAEETEPPEEVTEASGSESTAETASAGTEQAEEASGVTFETAEVGDVIEEGEDEGTYEIVKVAEDVGSFESGPITFTIERAYLAEFTPNESDAFLFEDYPSVDGVIHTLVTVVSAENTGEEYVAFDPFHSDVFVGGSKPYEAQAYLNMGETDISAGKAEDFVTAFNLEDEDLAEITEINVKQYAPSGGDYMKVGDDVEFTISFE